MSLPEVLLWQRLKRDSSKLKFRRQHSVGPYIVDFYYRDAALAVEIDGTVHDVAERAVFDLERDAFLRQNGLNILRIAASDVLRDPDAVAASIVSLVATPLHQPAAGPPPRAGEDRKD